MEKCQISHWHGLENSALIMHFDQNTLLVAAFSEPNIILQTVTGNEIKNCCPTVNASPTNGFQPEMSGPLVSIA
jgi:hypothetical protein